jgi:hypothetical protein
MSTTWTFGYRQTLALVALLQIAGLTMPSAFAQMGVGHAGRPKVPQTPQTSTITTETKPPAPSAAAVHLEAGALLCNSRDDLVQYQAQGAGSTAATPSDPPKCHVIRQQTGIEILERDGPSRTQVVTDDEAKETGWTNAYLPSTPPVPSGSTLGK